MPTYSIPPAAIAVNRPRASGPVVVSVPHAGRIYPPEILAAARVERSQLERLEDGWCDLLAAEAPVAGATVVLALWARAVADDTPASRETSNIVTTESHSGICVRRPRNR